MIQVPLETPRPIKYLLQISDIHFGALKSHEPYTHAFEELQKFIEKLPISVREETLLLITGDFFHHHAREHAETYEAAIQCLQKVTDLLPTLMIRGNHDIDIHAPSRVDAVRAAYAAAAASPTPGSSDTYIMYGPRMALLLSSGLFQVGNQTFGHLDVLDADPVKGPERLPPSPNPNAIALCHASLRHSKFFSSTAFEDTYLPLDLFASRGYKYVILGDIHRRQVLPHSHVMAAYPGSMIQLSYGEDYQDHGFALWDLERQQVTFHDLLCYQARLNVYVDPGTHELYFKRPSNVSKRLPLPSPSVAQFISIKIHYPPEVSSDKLQEIRKRLRDMYPNLQELSQQVIVPGVQNSSQIAPASSTEKPPAAPIPQFAEHYKASKEARADAVSYIENPTQIFTQEDIQTLQDTVASTAASKAQKENAKKILGAQLKNTRAAKTKNYVRFLKLSWSNLACFAEDNTLDLSARGIYCLLGPVYSGKSSVLDILSLVLFRRPIRQQEGTRVTSNHFLYYLRKGAPFLSVTLVFEVNGQTYEIMRKITSGIRATPKETLMRIDDESTKVPIATSHKEIDVWIQDNIGTLQDMLSSILMSQKNANNFLNLTSQQQLEVIQEWLSLDHLVSLHEYFTLAAKYFEGQYQDQRAKEQQILELQAQLQTSSYNQTTSKGAPDADALQQLRSQREHLLQVQRDLGRLQDIPLPPSTQPLKNDAVNFDEIYKQYHKLQGVLATQQQQFQKTKQELLRLQKEKQENEPPADFDPSVEDTLLAKIWEHKQKAPEGITTSRQDYQKWCKQRPDRSRYISLAAAEELLDALRAAKCSKLDLKDLKDPHHSLPAPTTTPSERRQWRATLSPPTHPDLKNPEKAQATCALLEREVYNPNCDKCRKRMKSSPETAVPETKQKCHVTLKEAQDALVFWEKHQFYEEEERRAKAQLVALALKAVPAPQEAIETAQIEAWVRAVRQDDSQVPFWERQQKLWPLQEAWQQEHDALQKELEITRAQFTLWRTAQRRKDLYKEYTALKAQVQSQEQELQKCKEVLQAHKWALQEALAASPLATIESKLQELEAAQHAWTLFTQQQAHAQKMQKIYTEQLDDIRKRKAHCKEKVSLSEHLADYFARDNPKGYFRDVLQHFLPELALSVNQCLQQIDPLQIELMAEGAHTQSTTMGLQIMLHDPEKNIKVPRAMWSGHQEFVIGLSFRIALSRFLSQTQFDHLIIDEGWTASDEAHLENLSPIFDLLRSRFYNTLLITHLRPVAHQADHFYKIERVGPWSKLQTENR